MSGLVWSGLVWSKLMCHPGVSWLQVTAAEAEAAWGPCTLPLAQWEGTSRLPSLKEVTKAGFANVMELLMHLPRAYEPHNRRVQDVDEQNVLTEMYLPSKLTVRGGEMKFKVSGSGGRLLRRKYGAWWPEDGGVVGAGVEGGLMVGI